MPYPALEVGVRRNLNKGGCELTRIESFGERSIVARYVRPLMPVLDFRRINYAVALRARASLIHGWRRYQRCYGCPGTNPAWRAAALIDRRKSSPGEAFSGMVGALGWACRGCSRAVLVAIQARRVLGRMA
jgi:hypothetical protein